MVNDLTPVKWLVAHPWTMAWVAFAKGMVIGAAITAAVYRSRERKSVTPSATRICRAAAWSPMVERSYRKRPELGSALGVSHQRASRLTRSNYTERCRSDLERATGIEPA